MCKGGNQNSFNLEFWSFFSQAFGPQLSIPSFGVCFKHFTEKIVTSLANIFKMKKILVKLIFVCLVFIC